jgi:Domain of unknown function (DUF5666)
MAEQRNRTGKGGCAAALLMTAALAACGGDAPAPGVITDGTGAPLRLSSGVMTHGSILVNGVRFDDSAATVRIDDAAASAAQLANGMVVEVRGRAQAGATTGTAEQVEVENELRGPITAIDLNAQPPRLTLLGQTVLVGSNTVFADVSGLAALAVGQRIEVHGLRDVAGNLRASRIELEPAQGGAPDELRGVIAGLSGTRFSLGTITVESAGATITPAGATLANGQPVEVHGSFNAATGVFTATRIDREDLEDAPIAGGANVGFDLQGFVSALDAAARRFTIGGRTIQFSATTRFERGGAADLANNLEVEVEGVLDAAGVLQATKIRFEGPRLIVQGVASAVNATARTITVLGQTVAIDDLTELRTEGSGGGSSSLADIVAGTDRVQVRGRLINGVLTAERVTETNDPDDELQAQVGAEDEAARRLTMLGVTVVLTAAEFRDAADLPITAAAFFAAVTPAGGGAAGTVVKVKGRFAAGTLTADEVEIES